MAQLGFDAPQVALYEYHKNGVEYAKELAVHLGKNALASSEDFGHFMSSLSWFLPRHYSVAYIENPSVGSMYPL